MGKLREARDKYNQQRDLLDRKLHDGTVLSPQEERRMIEIEEGLDALYAAIDYKTESINSKKEEIRQSASMAVVGLGCACCLLSACEIILVDCFNNDTTVQVISYMTASKCYIILYLFTIFM